MDDARGPRRRTTRTRSARRATSSAIGTEPRFAIGQRALLVPYGDSNLLWDCVTLLDDATAAEVERRGGLAAIAISHPHYYSAMVEWAQRFDCPIHLHAADAEWIMRSDPAIQHWHGETLDLGHGLTLIRGGGHFRGGTMLHRAEGARRAARSATSSRSIPDRSHVAFMWSYPNLVPLPEAEVDRMVAAVDPYSVRGDLRRVVGRDHPVGRAGDRAPLGRALRAGAARRARLSHGRGRSSAPRRGAHPGDEHGLQRQPREQRRPAAGHAVALGVLGHPDVRREDRDQRRDEPAARRDAARRAGAAAGRPPSASATPLA